jgi:hypothetical protein
MKTRGLKSFWGVVCLYGVWGWGVTAVLYAGPLLGAVGSHYWRVAHDVARPPQINDLQRFSKKHKSFPLVKSLVVVEGKR